MIKIWNIDPTLLTIPYFGLEIRYYGLIFAIVFIVGFLLFKWQIIKGGGTEDEAYDFMIPGIIGVVLGARLGEVLFYNFGYFLQNPLSILKVWEGGLSSHGATIGLILAVIYHSRKYKRNFLDTADRLSFAAALGASLVRLGNFFNSEIVGKVTSNITFGFKFPRYDQLPLELTPLRHPSQLYEFSFGIIILGVLLFVDRKIGEKNKREGLLSGLFCCLYFSARFIVEFFKERQGLNDDFILSRGQLLSLPGLIFGLILISRAYKRKKKL